jgi:hypothetical protein
VCNEYDAFGADDNEMRDSLDPITAERLLDGTADDPPALAMLLDRAAAKGRPIELTGEAAALAAFRAAEALPAAPTVPATPAVPRSPARRRWLTAVAAATFTFAFAGVAVAAGALPNPLRPAATTAPQPSKDTPSRAAPPSNGRGNGPTAAPPDAAVPGLCQAYLAQLAAGHEEELRNPRFAALVELAGGADRVRAYCEEHAARPSPGPSHGRPDRGPTEPPKPTPAQNPPGPPNPPEQGRPSRPSAGL